MEKRWVNKPHPSIDIVARLIEEISVSRPIASILAQRGVRDFEAAKSFFRPSVDQLHDPFLMLNMADAVNRIHEAIANSENILVYGDYDVDGTTAVALVFQYLTQEYEQVGYYIPDRYAEGYGISRQGVDFAIDNSFSLVIALDCGIKAIEQIDYAKENGVDFIVCDHHTPGEVLPNAIILNPKQKDCPYPFKELSGCGVGFKLVQGLAQIAEREFDELLPLLDLVVVSIGADMVSVLGENRVLAYLGLEVLKSNPRIGFSELLRLSQNQAPLNISTVVFSIAPRINAAGRIASGNKAVELLLAQSWDEVESISKEINAHNETRKGLDKSITEEALQQIEKDEWLLNAKSTVVYNAEWHKGVVGIVASRLIESHYRPTVVLTESQGELVGSARSVKGFNVYDAIAASADLLTRFGGHAYAAGLSLPKDNLTAFKMRFNAYVEELITKEQLTPEVEIDADIEFRDIFGSQIGGIPKFYRVLKQIAPFGPENLNPVFKTTQVYDAGYAKVLKDEHLKMQVYQKEYPEIRIDAIGFGMGHLYKEIKDRPFDLVYSIAENTWQGRTQLQLMIKDIRLR
jgi:single-stranded-DNA-specific exonuclease